MSISVEEISSHIRQGNVPADWSVWQPTPISPVPFILLGCIYAICMPVYCTITSALIIMLIHQETLIQSSPWPMFTTYPILIVLTIVCTVLVTYAGSRGVWKIEKQDRDMLLVSLPNGFIQYKHWSDIHKSEAIIIEYSRIKSIKPQPILAGVQLHICDRNGHTQKVKISWKYSSTSYANSMGHMHILTQIMEDYHRFQDNNAVDLQR